MGKAPDEQSAFFKPGPSMAMQKERTLMGFLDNVTSAVNRGTAAAGRSADKIKLNARIGELNRRQQGLAAQLGASLYEAAANEKDGE